MNENDIDYDVTVDMPKLKVVNGVIGYWPGERQGVLIPIYATADQLAKLLQHERQHMKDLEALFASIIRPMLIEARKFQGEAKGITVACDPTCIKCKTKLDSDIRFDQATKKYWDEFSKLNKALDDKQYGTVQRTGDKAYLVISW